jgi:hypothetical protein
MGALWFLLPLIAAGGVAAARLRTTNRRTALNRALHELRRPLQAIALAPGSPLLRGRYDTPGSLDLALAALDDLDVAINGTRPALSRRPVAARALVESSIERWRQVAAHRGRPVTLAWNAGPAILMADPARVAQAFDNLIANALEHGGGGVHVRAWRSPIGLAVAVTVALADVRPGRPDPRRGHGLAVIERVACAHLGRFRIHREGGRVRSVLELPLADHPVPAVPIEWAPASRELRSPGLSRAA